MNKLRIPLLISGLIAALATSKAPIDSGDSADHGDSDPDTALGECSERAVEDCSEQCRTIDGRLLQDDGEGGLCVDFGEEGEALACMDADGGCGDAETLAAPSADSDQCWWFPSTCVPEGWVMCSESTADECVD